MLLIYRAKIEQTLDLNVLSFCPIWGAKVEGNANAHVRLVVYSPMHEF